MDDKITSHASGELDSLAQEFYEAFKVAQGRESDLAMIRSYFIRAQQAMAEKAAQTIAIRFAAREPHSGAWVEPANVVREVFRSLAGAEVPCHLTEGQGICSLCRSDYPCWGKHAVGPPQDKLRELVAKWRKIIAECPVEHEKRWRDVFEAVETCASELEAASREPGASERT